MKHTAFVRVRTHCTPDLSLVAAATAPSGSGPRLVVSKCLLAQSPKSRGSIFFFTFETNDDGANEKMHRSLAHCVVLCLTMPCGDGASGQHIMLEPRCCNFCGCAWLCQMAGSIIPIWQSFTSHTRLDYERRPHICSHLQRAEESRRPKRTLCEAGSDEASAPKRSNDELLEATNNTVRSPEGSIPSYNTLSTWGNHQRDTVWLSDAARSQGFATALLIAYGPNPSPAESL